MHTPIALNFEDIKSERLPILDPGPHTPSLGTTLKGSYPVLLDLDDADDSPNFALTGDMGCGKTLALATIARRFADTGGRAVLPNIKEQGIGEYLRESGQDADVTVLCPSSGGSLRFPPVPGHSTRRRALRGQPRPRT